MADQAKFVLRRGTAIAFGEATGTIGGVAVTNTLSLDALASGSARMSAEVDLGADMPLYVDIIPFAETGTAPTAGLTADVYPVFSHDGTNYAAGVTGSDAAWPADGNEDEWAAQLGQSCPYVATNDGNTVGQQECYRVPCLGRYMVIVYDNNLGQALRDEATAANNGSGVVAYPVFEYAIDP